MYQDPCPFPPATPRPRPGAGAVVEYLDGSRRAVPGRGGWPDLELSETPFDRVARGDFRWMQMPLWVACGSTRELRDFMNQYALEPREVVRFRRCDIHSLDEQRCRRRGKIVLTLPGWGKDRKTVEAVQLWVMMEGHTVEMETVTVPFREKPGFSLAGYAAFVAGLVGAIWWVSTW